MEWASSDCVVLEGQEAISHVRSGSLEEIPYVQGQEQRLCFAGVVVKRYSTSKVRETPLRE